MLIQGSRLPHKVVSHHDHDRPDDRQQQRLEAAGDAEIYSFPLPGSAGPADWTRDMWLHTTMSGNRSLTGLLLLHAIATPLEARHQACQIRE